MKDVYTPPTFPMIRFFVRYGMGLSLAVGLLVAVSVWWLGDPSNGQWFWTLAGIACGGLLSALLASYVEVLKIVSDTLVPR